jgi:hypothetical protein
VTEPIPLNLEHVAHVARVLEGGPRAVDGMGP